MVDVKTVNTEPDLDSSMEKNDNNSVYQISTSHASKNATIRVVPEERDLSTCGLKIRCYNMPDKLLKLPQDSRVADYVDKKSPRLSHKERTAGFSRLPEDVQYQTVSGSQKIRSRHLSLYDRYSRNTPQNIIYAKSKIIPPSNYKCVTKFDTGNTDEDSPSFSDTSEIRLRRRSPEGPSRLNLSSQRIQSPQSFGREQLKDNYDWRRERNCPVNCVRRSFPNNGDYGNELCIWQSSNYNNQAGQLNSCQHSKFNCGSAGNRGKQIIHCMCRSRNQSSDSFSGFQNNRNKTIPTIQLQCKPMRPSAVYTCDYKSNQQNNDPGQPKMNVYLYDFSGQDNQYTAPSNNMEQSFIIGTAGDIGQPEDPRSGRCMYLCNANSDANLEQEEEAEAENVDCQNVCFREITCGESDLSLNSQESCELSTYCIMGMVKFLFKILSNFLRSVCLCGLFAFALAVIIVYIPINILSQATVELLILLLMHILVFSPDNLFVYKMFS